MYTFLFKDLVKMRKHRVQCLPEKKVKMLLNDRLKAIKTPVNIELIHFLVKLQ